MATPGVNGAEQAQMLTYKQLETIDLSKTNQNQLSEILSGLRANADATVDDALAAKADEEAGHITIQEFNKIISIEDAVLLLKQKVNTTLASAGDELKTTYDNAVATLDKIYTKLRDSYRKAKSTDFEVFQAIKNRKDELANTGEAKVDNLIIEVESSWSESHKNKYPEVYKMFQGAVKEYKKAKAEGKNANYTGVISRLSTLISKYGHNPKLVVKDAKGNPIRDNNPPENINKELTGIISTTMIKELSCIGTKPTNVTELTSSIDEGLVKRKSTPLTSGNILDRHGEEYLERMLEANHANDPRKNWAQIGPGGNQQN